ncbi:hypothetical protein BVY03_01655 [bacterium K02(2017)]|nr:hypothetical protein BVY03_01655 [bacterium K02(2017)]
MQGLESHNTSLLQSIKKLTDIGTALSAENRIPVLLEKILDNARELTNAEGGTLYLVAEDKKFLNFEIIQNGASNIRMGGTAQKVTWSPVPLFNDDGSENHNNVSTYVASTGQLINIDDVYNVKNFDFSGTKTFDQKNNYRSKSMLVVALRDHENEIIGVLQLLNAKDKDTNQIIAFSDEAQALTLSFASKVAVTLTKNRLILELENLFEAFIRSIAKAIDEKSPYTGGHVKRVADIAIAMAEELNKTKEGYYADIKFNEDDMKELLIAAWMHDIGKITTPEYVIDKSTKLETIYDRISEIKLRFEVLKRDQEIIFLKNKLDYLSKQANSQNSEPDYSELETNYQKQIKIIDDNLAFITKVNRGGEFLPDEDIAKINSIGSIQWNYNNQTINFLTENEIYNLSIKKGTLTKEERAIIQDHVRMTEVMLKELPFPKKLKNVPEFAAGHHETLDGSGYHRGLKGDEISLQARILAIADIFEALSASDRPYKPGKKASEVLKIMGFMVKDNHIDKNLYDLFINSRIFHNYVKENYKPEQIDITLD